jgi:hypothetical protein
MAPAAWVVVAGRPARPDPGCSGCCPGLASSQTPRPSLEDSTSEPAPSRVATVWPWRTRYTTESASQPLPRQSRRETTTASSPTDSTWTERSSSAGKPITGRVTLLSRSRTNGSGSLATSSRNPAGPRSGTPGNDRTPAWPSRRSSERAPRPCSQGATVATVIAAATSSTPTPAATIQRDTAGRPGGRWSRGPVLAMPLLPNPTCAGSRR